MVHNLNLSVIATLVVATGADVVKITVQGQVRSVSPAFVSFTIDSASVCEDRWSFPSGVDDTTISRINHLSPFVLRFGGTSQDYEQLVGPSVAPSDTLSSVWHLKDGCNITASKWSDLLQFSERVGAKLVYGENALLRVGGVDRNPFDPTNAAVLMNLTKDHPSRASLIGLTLGNEPTGWQMQHISNMSAAEHAADYAILRKSIRSTLPGSETLMLLGPDLYQFTYKATGLYRRYR